MSMSRIALLNDRSTVLPVMVEMTPDLFNLQPGERLEMTFDPANSPVEIELSDEGLKVFPNSDYQPAFTIDGRDAARRSWSD